MTAESTSEEGQESGGALRDKLEETNSENRALREALAAKTVSGLKFVTADDLKDVAPGDLDDRAAALESERAEQRNSVLVEELKARGLDDEQIEQLAGTPVSTATTPSSLEQIGNVGVPARRPAPGSEEGLYGQDRIRAAYGG